MPSGSALTSTADCARAVAPHLDRQEDAEEQRGDERREHEGETDVGDGHVAATRPRIAVQLTLAPLARAAGSAATRRAPAATGAWTKKIARHANSSVRKPPRAGPTATPTAAGEGPPPAGPSLARDDRDEHGQ